MMVGNSPLDTSSKPTTPKGTHKHMSETRKLTVRGIPFKTRSHFRYQLVQIRDGKVAVWGRTDNLAVARKRVAAWNAGHVIIDAETNTEVPR